MSDVTLEAVSENDPNLKRKPASSAPRATFANDPKKPDFRSAFHVSQLPTWQMIDALLDGTPSMRSGGETYLPRFASEERSNWERRLNCAVLLNYFRKTVEGYTGKPFGKPLEIPEELPESLKPVLEDVDGNGTNFDMFAQRGFEKGVAKGIIHALIDFPTATAEDTAEDEQAKQPIVTLIEPERLIGARCDAEGELTQVRIYECTMEPDGAFGEKKIERVRVIERDKFQVWKREAKRWTIESEGVNTLGEIPLATFNADPEGFMCARPPLLDLAYKNVEHWQSSSDQRNVLSIARFPILVGTGVNPSDPLTIGPNSYFGMREPSADLKFVEHSGAAISAGRQDLEDLKAEMAILGLTLLLPQQSGAPTATAKAMDGVESVTELQRLVMTYENFLNEVNYWLARWQDVPEEEAADLPKIRINQDYAKLLNMDAGVNALLTARAGKDISRDALIDALKRRNMLPADFDKKKNDEALKEEAKSAGNGLPPAAPSRFGLRATPAPAPEKKVKPKLKITRDSAGKATAIEEE